MEGERDGWTLGRRVLYEQTDIKDELSHRVELVSFHSESTASKMAKMCLLTTTTSPPSTSQSHRR